MRATIIHRIEAEKLIAIVRLDQQSKVHEVLEGLVAAGIKVMEITSNTPGYAEAIKDARKKYQDVLIGAGTITNAKLAEEAVSCGAQFLVTPNTNTDVIAIAHRSGIPVLMGAMTPTDIATAVEHGADFIKLFPAQPLGLEYFTSLLGPFNKVKFIAVGGISLSNASAWLQAGVHGLGIGSSLTNGDPAEIKSKIATLINKIEK